MEEKLKNEQDEQKNETEEFSTPDYSGEILEFIRSNPDDTELADILSDYHESDIADAYEQLTTAERKHLYETIGVEKFSEIFSYVENPEELLEEMPLKDAANVLEHMDADDAADILEEVDEQKVDKLVNLMSEENSKDIRLIQSYDDDEIGSRLTTNMVVIRNTLTIKEAMKSLVSQAGDNDNISTIYVVDTSDVFYGALNLKDLIIARKENNMDDLISTSYPYFNHHDKIADCLERMKDYTEDSLPILDDDGHLLGIITAQSVTEAVDAEMGEDYAKFAGLAEEDDLSEGVFVSIKKRIPWLLILLFLSLGVSGVVGMFSDVVATISVVACFQSLVLGMAGNTGTQSLAVTIRVIADKSLSLKERVFLVFKEMRVGLCNGLILGALAFAFVGIYVHFLGYGWGESYAVSACVGIALLVAMFVSALVGTCMPLLFARLGIDPAVASGPFITTLNDLNAVLIYYGLSWFLLIDLLHFTS